VWIFFIFWPNKIHVNPTDVVSFLSSVWCRLFFDRRCHAVASCPTSFPWSQDELAASASSSGNALSRRLHSRAETTTLNLHHRRHPSSSDCPTPTLYCYKKVMSILATLTTTQSRLHFASSLARALRYQSSTRRRCSLSPSSLCTTTPTVTN
jgi:hypothetical protein